MLSDILVYFGIPNGDPGNITSVLPTRVFSVNCSPNPFNALIRIEYTMPERGHLDISIYNVRGQLVRKVIDETVASGAAKLAWDGRDERGANVASGAYFYVAKKAGERKVGKIVLVK